MALLKKLSIAQRISVSFTVLVALLMVVASCGYLGLQGVGDLFLQYRSASSSTLAIADIVDGFSNIRETERQYRLAPQPATVEEFLALSSQIEEKIALQQEAFASDPEASALLASIGQKLSELTAAFEQGITVQAAREASLAEMANHATNARNSLQEILSAATTANHTPSVVKASSGSEAVLKMLLLAEQYVHSGNAADFDKIPSLAAWAKQVIKSMLPLLEMSIAEALPTGHAALAEIDPYVEAARALKGATEQRDALRAINDGIGPSVKAQLGELQDWVSARQATFGQSADTARATLGPVVLVVGLISILLGAALAVTIGGGLSRAIKKMASDMYKIAEGELDIILDTTTTSGELGQMIRALEVFKENGQAVRAASRDKDVIAREDANRAAAQQEMQREVVRVVDAALNGDFAVRIERSFNNAEHQQLARALNQLMQTVDQGLQETGSVMSAFARSDLTRRMTGEYHGAFARLRDDINLAAESFSVVVGRIQSTSRGLRSATGEIVAGANDLSGRTTRQAATIEKTSATIAQLANHIALSADNAEGASRKSDRTVELADEGGRTMMSATEAMIRISDSSMQISGIIGLIDDIAFQTNLLALNASVEAARAGEAGQGFAVVAIEVRRLAQSAAEASAQIKALVEQSVNNVQVGANLVKDAERKLDMILKAVRENGQLMQGISQESRRQVATVRDVTTAVRSLDEMTQHNAALVEQTNAAIEQTEEQASELDEIVRRFAVSEVARVRAA